MIGIIMWLAVAALGGTTLSVIAWRMWREPILGWLSERKLDTSSVRKALVVLDRLDHATIGRVLILLKNRLAPEVIHSSIKVISDTELKSLLDGDPAAFQNVKRGNTVEIEITTEIEG